MLHFFHFCDAPYFNPVETISVCRCAVISWWSLCLSNEMWSSQQLTIHGFLSWVPPVILSAVLPDIQYKKQPKKNNNKTHPQKGSLLIMSWTGKLMEWRLQSSPLSGAPLLSLQCLHVTAAVSQGFFVCFFHS